MKRATRYFGYLLLAIQWVGFGLCCLLHPINLSEPFSQFGYYPETKLVFGLTMTLASVVYYFFARELDRYWRYTSTLIGLGGVCICIVGWVPYEPYIQGYVFDLHNAAITLTIALGSLPMLFMGFTKKHARIARISQIAFFAALLFSVGSIVGRAAGLNVLYLQVLTLLVAQAWVGLCNHLVLQHYSSRAQNSTGKL